MTLIDIIRIGFSVTLNIFTYRNFGNVMCMAVERAKQIPEHHRILFWHHCMKHIFGYLVHKRL